MANSEERSKSFKLVNQGNLDGWYGPYDSVALANTAIPLAIRLQKTVGINTADGIVEYWWKNGNFDTDLVLKSTEDRVVLSNNLFDKDKLITGTYIDYQTGAEVYVSGYSATYYLDAEPGAYISNNTNNAYAFFSRAQIGGYISGTLVPSNGIITAPAGTKYMRTYILDAEKDIFQINKGTAILTYDNFKKGSNDFAVQANKVAGVDLLGLQEITENVGLFDKTKIRAKTYVDYLTGKVERLDDANNYYTYRTRIKPGSIYEFGDTHGQQYAFYSRNGAFITGKGYAMAGSGATGESKIITTPLNAAYMVFSGMNAYINNQHLVEKKGLSIYDNYARKQNGYIDYTTGNFVAVAGYEGTITLPVKPNTDYEFGTTAGQQLAWFTKDGMYISGYAAGVSGESKILTSPNGAFLIAFTTLSTETAGQYFREVPVNTLVKTIKITAVKNASNWNSIRTIAGNIKDSSALKKYEIYVPNGTWNEIDWQGWGDYIKIIGQDRYKTIINTDGTDTNVTHTIPADYLGYGGYAGQQVATVPLIWKHCIFWVKNLIAQNLTFKAINCKYVVHADNVKPATLTLTNCSFEETGCNFVIGMGVWGGQSLLFENCSLKRNTAGQKGILYHNWNNQTQGSKTVFKNNRFIDCDYVDISELGSDQDDQLILENCSTNLETKSVRFSVALNGSDTFYTKPGTSVKETNPLLVPYSTHLIVAGTNVYNYDISSGQRPDAVASVQQGATSLSKTDIINDLNTGGITKMLSAEQGKIMYKLLAYVMGYEPETLAVIKRAFDSGYTASSASYITKLNGHIKALKLAGIFNKLDVAYWLVGDGDLNFKTINIIDPNKYKGTPLGGLINSNSGVKGNAVDGYIDTTFNATLGVNKYNVNAASRGGYAFDIGVIAGASKYIDGTIINSYNVLRLHTSAGTINATEVISGSLVGIGFKAIIITGSNAAKTISETNVVGKTTTEVALLRSVKQDVFKATAAGTYSDVGLSTYFIGGILTDAEAVLYRTAIINNL